MAPVTMARKSGPSLLMLYTMRCALSLAAAVPVALVAAAAVLDADAAQPVAASAPMSTVAPNRAAGWFLSMCISLAGFGSGVPVAQQRPRDQDDGRVAGEHRKLAPGGEQMLRELALGVGDRVGDLAARRPPHQVRV